MAYSDHHSRRNSASRRSVAQNIVAVTPTLTTALRKMARLSKPSAAASVIWTEREGVVGSRAFGVSTYGSSQEKEMIVQDMERFCREQMRVD